LKCYTLTSICVMATATPSVLAQFDVHLVFDRTEVMVGETIQATLVATIDGSPEWYFSALATDLVASDPSLGLASAMSGLDWAMPALGQIQSGTPDGASLLGLFGAQHPLFGPADTSSPFVIGQFTITALTPGELTYTSRWSTSSTGSFQFTGPSFPGGPAWASELTPTETITIRPVPAPASVGLLGFVTLMGRRRRGAV
jgi:hypothetical protein